MPRVPEVTRGGAGAWGKMGLREDPPFPLLDQSCKLFPESRNDGTSQRGHLLCRTIAAFLYHGSAALSVALRTRNRNFRPSVGRLTYEGWLPKDQKSWKGLLFRLPVAISLSYSAIGMFSPASVVLLIAFIFSILTLLLSFFAGEDREFQRWWGGVRCFSLFLGLCDGRCGMIRIHGRTSDLIDA